MSCVLALALDHASEERFERERQQWFPPALNRVPAHLSLFHTLPEDDETHCILQAEASRQQTFWMQVESVRSLGRGVAYFMAPRDAKTLHASLSAAFAPHLSAQDRQGFRPHVVVQNKANPLAVQQALLSISSAFQPWKVQAVGLDLWRYLDGPWLHLQRFVFQQG